MYPGTYAMQFSINNTKYIFSLMKCKKSNNPDIVNNNNNKM